MTVDEVKERKAKLEKEMLNEIQAFEKETGASVDMVDVFCASLKRDVNETAAIQVNIDVKL